MNNIDLLYEVRKEIDTHYREDAVTQKEQWYNAGIVDALEVVDSWIGATKNHDNKNL